MARYLVHYYVVNDVVTETPMGGADWIDKQFVEFHKTFGHNKASKAIETFKKLVECEQARWKEFVKITGDKREDLVINFSDPNRVYEKYFEVRGCGHAMHGSPECISRVWIEDTKNFKQTNNAVRSKRIEKQSIKNFHDSWGIKDTIPYIEELPFR